MSVPWSKCGLGSLLDFWIQQLSRGCTLNLALSLEPESKYLRNEAQQSRFSKARPCLPQALLSLCSPGRVVEEHGHSLFGWKFWPPHAGLQAYLILASCRTSFKTSVWAARTGSGISHFRHSHRNATKQDSARGKGGQRRGIHPHWPGPFSDPSAAQHVAIFPQEKLHPGRLCQQKCMKAIFYSSRDIPSCVSASHVLKLLFVHAPDGQK